MLLELPEGEHQSNCVRFQVPRGKFSEFAGELKQPGVTLRRLWQEYREQRPDGHRYSHFCHHFQLWRSSSELAMHINHKAGRTKTVRSTLRWWRLTAASETVSTPC